jgi:hypothetical protein
MHHCQWATMPRKIADPSEVFPYQDTVLVPLRIWLSLSMMHRYRIAEHNRFGQNTPTNLHILPGCYIPSCSVYNSTLRAVCYLIADFPSFVDQGGLEWPLLPPWSSLHLSARVYNASIHVRNTPLFCTALCLLAAGMVVGDRTQPSHVAWVQSHKVIKQQD